MRSLACFALAALAAAVVAAPAMASPLVVPLDQSTRLNVAGAAASVLVGNPQIADVTVIDSHTLYILGRGYGATDLVVLDRAGRPLLTQDLVVSSADAGRVSIYRGADRTDMACAPGCQVTIRSGQKGGGATASGGSAPAAGGAAGLPGSLAALTGGVASGAGAAGSAAGGAVSGGPPPPPANPPR